MKILLLGVGALGSTTSFVLSRHFASTDSELTLILLDNDSVEERNLFSQVFSPLSLGHLKVDAAKELAKQSPAVRVIPAHLKLELESLPNVEAFTAHSDSPVNLIIDSFDNVASRQLACKLGELYECPVIHQAVSQTDDIGYVNWTDGFTTDFSHHPLLSEGLIAPTADPTKRKPCELVDKLPLLWNTALSTIHSIQFYRGLDPFGHLVGEDGVSGAAPLMKVSWEVTSFTRRPRPFRSII